MNILVLNWRDAKHPQAGGAEVHFHELFSRFVKNGHNVILLTTRYKGSTEQDTIDGITVYRYGHTFTFNWEAPFLVKRICAKHAVDCIIDDVNKLPFFSPHWFPNIPCGVIFHHLFGSTVFSLAPLPFALYVHLLERLSMIMYKKTPCCTVSASTAAELIEGGFDKQNISIIENSVDTNKYCPVLNQQKEPDMLFYAGRLKKYKNISLVIDAVKILKDQGRTLRFVIAGAGDEEANLKAQVKRLDLESQVSFLGFVSEQEKIDLYRKATIFVNPSCKEGWGITSIEAGACGTAVVANNVCGLRDSVKHNKTGLLYQENDISDFLKCIHSILDNTELRKSFEFGGREWALGFSWDQSYIKMEKWASSITNRKKPEIR